MDLPGILLESILACIVIFYSCLLLTQYALRGQVAIFVSQMWNSKRQHCARVNSKCGVSDPHNRNNLRFLTSKMRIKSS